MKKILFLLLLVFLIASCGKKDNQNEQPKEPVIEISLNNETVDSFYYVDEFNLSSIQLIKKVDEETSTVLLKESMIVNCPDFDKAGTYNVQIQYEGVTIPLTIILKDKVVYTTGLEFGLNTKGDAYQVIGYTGKEANVLVPETYNELPVKEIKSNAFKNNQVIKTIDLPSSVYKIGDNAFHSSTIEQIDLSNITYIGNAAFYLCEGLEEVKLNKNITYVGNKTFDNVKLIFIEKGAKTSSWSTDYHNENTSHIYYDMILSNIIIDGDFEYYVNNDHVELVNYLNNETASVVVPDTFNKLPVTIIGHYAIYNHLEITELELPNSIQYILTHGVQELSITSLTLPDELLEISSYGVACCRKMVTLNFNNKLQKICQAAFSSSEVLSVVKLPHSLVTIEGFAFQNCYKITEMYIPSSVTTIGAGCFYSNGKSKIYLEAASIPAGFESGWNPSNRPITYSCVFDY